MTTSLRIVLGCIVLFTALLLTGCPQRDAAPTDAAAPAQEVSAQEPTAAPAPVNDPAKDAVIEPAPGSDTKALASTELNRACTQDSDCAVKDIGSCCGYFPACVHQDAKTDPARVKAECEKQGLSSICGFQDIQSCQCVSGQCQASGSGPQEVTQ